MTINNSDLKQRFSYGDWKLETMEELLDLNEPVVRAILSLIPSDTLVVALHNETKEIKDHFLNNCSERLRKHLIDQMKTAGHSLSAIQAAQEVLLSITQEQCSQLEQRLWDEMISTLPTENLPEGDIKLIYSLDHPETKRWMDKTPIKQQLQILTDDDDSAQFWETKMKPVIGEKEAGIIEQNWEKYEPQFSWEIEISRALVTSHINKQR